MKLHHMLIALPILLGSAATAQAQVSIGIRTPSVSIGINMPSYPQLVPIPGYPVYYDPQTNFNYFFYDGLYWVYQDDNWYASSWYNGPWELTDPNYVPLYVLRVPVRYYRRPPAYFRGWRSDAPPHWDEHWGRDWNEQHRGWNQWDRHAAPRPAPLPVYQRQYSERQYPRTLEQQHAIRSENYRYQPREAVTRQHFQERGGQTTVPQDVRRQPPIPQREQQTPRERSIQQQPVPVPSRPPIEQPRAEPNRHPPSVDVPRPEHAQPERQDNGRAGRQDDRPNAPDQGREHRDNRDDERSRDRR